MATELTPPPMMPRPPERPPAVPQLQRQRYVQGDKQGYIKIHEFLSVSRETTVGELVDDLANNYSLSDSYIVKAIGRFGRKSNVATEHKG